MSAARSLDSFRERSVVEDLFDLSDLSNHSKTIVNERSDGNDKVLCDMIILAQVPLFQVILSEFWTKSSGDARII
jgi:hypothetical protein